MKILRTLLFILLILIILFLLISLFLPSTVHVDESITIKSNVNNTFSQINNLKNWQKWSPYQQSDPKMLIKISLPSEGIGAKQSWVSKEIGNGSISIREVIPDKSISGDLIYDNDTKALSLWEFEPAVEGTKLTWSIDVIDLSYPFGRWAGLFMGNNIHNTIQRGLNNIKSLVESNLITKPVIYSSYGKTSEVTESEMHSMIILSIKDSCKIEEFSIKFKEMYAEINSYIKATNSKQIAPPFAIYHSWNPKGLSVVEACIRINKYLKNKGRIIFTEVPQYKIASVIHYGPYSTIGSAYDILEKYIKNNNKSIANDPREVYLTDPSLVNDSTRWETQVYYPIR